jgi:hypothetical protein
MPLTGATETYPIVGAFFRPPAKTILDILPIGTPLTLLAEPENEYDTNAIAIYIAFSVINTMSEESLGALDASLTSSGFNLARLEEMEHIHLGYIPKAIAARLKANGRIVDNTEVEGEFVCSTAGAPKVRIEAES